MHSKFRSSIYPHRVLMFFGLLCICGLSTFAVEPQKHSYKPRSGFVPDKVTAVRIAEAVLMPIYGEKKIKHERPFVANLINKTWIVSGSLPKGQKGGVAVIEIAKSDAKIIRVSHGK